MKIENRYLDGSYLAANPDWDRQDSAWKAQQVTSILQRHHLDPASVCEVGCGAGDILRHLQVNLPRARMVGYDISPQLPELWSRAGDGSPEFVLGDFHEINTQTFDLVMMLDVFEHVRDPFSFLEGARRHGRHFVFHIPLDLSAVSVARGAPLMRVRRGVGHLHFYTKDLALETLKDSGYRVIEWRYTGAALSGSSRSWATRLAAVPRRFAYAIDRDFGVRLLGGETLIVLAEAA
jgi:SAM-dependent methyltransferase